MQSSAYRLTLVANCFHREEALRCEWQRGTPVDPDFCNLPGLVLFFCFCYFFFLISPGSSLHGATGESHILLTHIYLLTNIGTNGELPLGCCDAQGAQEYCFSHFKCEHLQIRYTTYSQNTLVCKTVCDCVSVGGWGGGWVGWGSCLWPITSQHGPKAQWLTKN